MDLKTNIVLEKCQKSIGKADITECNTPGFKTNYLVVFSPFPNKVCVY